MHCFICQAIIRYVVVVEGVFVSQYGIECAVWMCGLGGGGVLVLGSTFVCKFVGNFIAKYSICMAWMASRIV